MAFDLVAYKRHWRELCEKHGIDPVEGATTYQVVNVRVEQRKAEPSSCWWAEDAQMWAFAPPYHSDLEETVLFKVFYDARETIYLRELGVKKRCLRPKVRNRRR